MEEVFFYSEWVLVLGKDEIEVLSVQCAE